jgi:hypothetical protein
MNKDLLLQAFLKKQNREYDNLLLIVELCPLVSQMKEHNIGGNKDRITVPYRPTER